MKINEETVNAIIRRRAECVGIGQAELGRKIGLTKYKVWACFTDRRRFTAGEFIRVCRVLGLTLEDFGE